MIKFPNSLRFLIICILAFQFSACGTILYPERRGQTAGRLDVGVVLLDAIGLLFFLIPGVIAFAVDFSNGSIYLPASRRTKLKNGDYRIVKFDPQRTSPEQLEAILRKETGKDIKFSDQKMKRVKLENQNEIPAFFAYIR